MDLRHPLPYPFFDRDPREVAPALLGCTLVSTAGGVRTGGVIVETEAYLGQNDPGSHAATRGITPRNAVMYRRPGTVYVYFTYGCHHMLNIVCCPQGSAGAVLIRALEPTVGIQAMSERRAGRTGVDLANGPGKLASALAIDLSDNGDMLEEGRLTVYDAARSDPSRIATGGRVGLSKGRELPYRYYLKDSAAVSRAR